MKKVLTVRELICLLTEFNMNAFVNVIFNGTSVGIGMADICWMCGEGDSDSGRGKEKAQVVYIDVDEGESEDSESK